MTLFYIALIEHTTGAVSGFGAMIVIMTYLLFPDLRRLRYMELVFYVSINDFVGSLGIALGPLRDGTFACWFQGLSSNFCYVASTLWTTVISYQVWLVIIGKNVINDMRIIHSLCWGIPLIATLLPLSTNTYGHYKGEGYWCYIADRSDSPHWGYEFWGLFAFYLWVWLALLISIILLVKITIRLRQMQQQIPDVVRYTLQKLQLYPMITMVCWGLNTVGKIYFLFNYTTSTRSDYIWDKIYIASIGIAILQGLFNAIVFILMNPNVQQRWISLFHGDFKVLQDRESLHEAALNGRNTKSGVSYGSWRWSKSSRMTRMTLDNEMQSWYEMRESARPSASATGTDMSADRSSSKPRVVSMSEILSERSSARSSRGQSGGATHCCDGSSCSEEIDGAVNPIVISGIDKDVPTDLQSNVLDDEEQKVHE